MTRFPLLAQEINGRWNYALLITMNRYQTCKEDRFSQPLWFCVWYIFILIKHESCVTVCVLLWSRFLKPQKIPASWHFGSRRHLDQFKTYWSLIFQFLIFRILGAYFVFFFHCFFRVFWAFSCLFCFLFFCFSFFGFSFDNLSNFFA